MSKDAMDDQTKLQAKKFSEIENGFYIKPSTFYKNKLDGDENLEDDIVIVENIEVELDGRTTPVYQKKYYFVKEDLAISSTKREVTDNLREQMKNYMLQNEHWPPFTELKKKYKNGKVKVEYNADNWTSFKIKFDEEIDSQDTSQFLESLKKYGDYLGKPEELQWKVEHAKSSRAKCRGCSEKIEKGTVRIGEPAEYQGRVYYKWYHVDCASRKKYRLKPVFGLEDLSKEELEELVFYELIDQNMV